MGSIDKLRLIAFLEGQPKGSEKLLVGYADTVGQFDGNLSLSRQRTQLVAQARYALEGIAIDAVGFGELAPTTCNDNDRRINRRVEVWIRSPR